ncbi:hypothetical protein OG225_43370 (plasmid) [Nocardia sp. NBC_01377]|uniref:hypothetical protein n=1 Tax=Nocardia sp. NBC_01377 TaxID=2903595 RepID=UPI0032507C63
MFEERHRPVRWVDPPIEVRVLAARLWSPQRLGWGSDTALWQRSAGLRIEEEIPGRLEELVITSVGDVVARVRFAPLIGRVRSSENMLLPWGTWVPMAEMDARRLRGLVLEFGIDRDL